MTNRKTGLRRREAGKHLYDTYGFGSFSMLSQLACVGGGPKYHRLGPKTIIYLIEDLDAWALEKLGNPVQSTSEYETPSHRRQKDAGQVT